jgi:hypothetical protein
VQGRIRFAKIFKCYSKNQWLWYWEQIWFDRVGILHAIMSRAKHCWWTNNNYTKKLVTERLSQTTYDFLNILGIIQVGSYCTWSWNINQSIIELIIN